MDTVPLPPRPDLEHYRKRAKELLRAARSDDPAAVRAWADEWIAALARTVDVNHPPFVQQSIDRATSTLVERVGERRGDADARRARFSLADAQRLVARAHGFDSWAAFGDTVLALQSHDSPFEQAADAVIAGDLAGLERLVQRHPALLRARSPRQHRATLLHYLSANGVEDHRQRTPGNAVAVARYLLQAGAEVDAVADTYGGGSDQTTLNLLVSSVHPSRAGLQSSLVEALVDFGAALNGLDDDGSPIMSALAFGYPDAARTLATRGARVDGVLAPAALGLVDQVERSVVDARRLAPGVPLVAPRWLRLPNEHAAHIGLALVWAARFGELAVVDALLERGVSLQSADADGMTALHWASATGQLPVMARLLERGAALEARNRWGGTVLGTVLHFATHDPLPGVDFPAVVRALVAAGAAVGAHGAPSTGDDRLDEALRASPGRSA